MQEAATRPAPGALARAGHACETASVTSGGTSDGQVGAQQGSHRATALRPRRLVGREREIAEVIESVALTPLTTVTGPGGVGKTALALAQAVAAASAAQFPDGVFVVWLASFTGPERTHLEVLRRIEDNTRIALECLLRIDPRAALELAASLNIFWWTQGRLGEGIGWLERAREAALDAPAELRATSLFCEGFLVAHDTDDRHAAARLIDVGLDAIAGASEPPLILAMLHCLRGECGVFNGDLTSAVVRTQTGLEISSLYPGTWGRGFCLWNAAYARLAVGDEDAAIALFMEMIDLTSAGGYAIGEMTASNSMGEIWEARGVLDTSRAFWERALYCRREVGALRIGHVHGTMPTALLAVARVADKQGDLATASKLLREGLPIAEETREVATAQQMAELLRKTSQVEPTQRATLRPEGGVWRIDFNGTNVHVPDLKGLWHLRELVSRPREFVPALVPPPSVHMKALMARRGENGLGRTFREVFAIHTGGRLGLHLRGPRTSKHPWSSSGPNGVAAVLDAGPTTRGAPSPSTDSDRKRRPEGHAACNRFPMSHGGSGRSAGCRDLPA